MFEDYKNLADPNPSQVPTSLGSEINTMVDGGVDKEQGETEFVDNDSKFRKEKHLNGRYKDAMSDNGLWNGCRGGRF